jgi:hypothetical protein
MSLLTRSPPSAAATIIVASTNSGMSSRRRGSASGRPADARWRHPLRLVQPIAALRKYALFRLPRHRRVSREHGRRLLGLFANKRTLTDLSAARLPREGYRADSLHAGRLTRRDCDHAATCAFALTKLMPGKASGDALGRRAMY